MVQNPLVSGIYMSQYAQEIESAFDAESLKKAERLVKEYNLNYIGKPEIIRI